MVLQKWSHWLSESSWNIKRAKRLFVKHWIVTLDIDAERIVFERDDTDSDNLFNGSFVLHQVYCCQASSLFMLIGL